MEYGKIKSVTLEFENAVISLNGPGAEEWQKMVNGQAVLAHVHGAKYEQLPWSIVPSGMTAEEKD